MSPHSLTRLFLLAAVAIPCACSKKPEGGGASEGATPPAKAGPDTLAQIDAFIARHDKEKGGDGKIDRAKPAWKQSVPQPPKFEFDPAKTYVWTIETNRGVMRAKLWPDVAPYHCSNFMYLARLGFFDGLTFHRIIPQFMAQGGDPEGTGGGGPGYGYAGEFDPKARHNRPYLLSTANVQGNPMSDGSQFFVTFVPTPNLDNMHTLFGELMDDDSKATARALENVGTPGGAPKQPVTIVRATVEAK